MRRELTVWISKIGSVTVPYVARSIGPGKCTSGRVSSRVSLQSFSFFVVIECKQVGLNFPRSFKDFVSKVVLVKVSVGIFSDV